MTADNTGKKRTVRDFRNCKAEGIPLTVLTAYDAPTAALAHAAGVDMLLVGDSVTTTVMGYATTLPATMEDMLHHAACVRRGAPGAFVIGDMPFMSYQVNADTAVANAARFLKEAGCDAVKIEGGADYAELIERLVTCGIPVMAHVGLLPQHVLTSGGYRKTGKTEADAERIMRDAKAVEEAGAFAVVLECLQQEVADAITRELSIPTIGIGAGPGTDGQVQVVQDLLGLSGAGTPKHARCYADLYHTIQQAFENYVRDVRTRNF